MSRWFAHCGNRKCHEVFQVELEAGDWTKLRKEAVLSGWRERLDDGFHPKPLTSLFCSDKCYEFSSKLARLHKPLNAIGWAEVYGLDTDDMEASRRHVSSMQDPVHREFCGNLLEWIRTHRLEINNIEVEYARWKLKSLYGVDAEQADKVPPMPTASTGDVLVWRAQREERHILRCFDEASNAHDVWHWGGYGIVCPSLWLTHGSFEWVAALLVAGFSKGYLRPQDEAWKVETYERMVAKLREAAS